MTCIIRQVLSYYLMNILIISEFFFQEISAVKRPNVLRINKIHALFKNNRMILSPFITPKSRKHLNSSSIQTR